MSESANGNYQTAPPGFTPAQWDDFMRKGYLVFEDAIAPEDVARYLEAMDRLAASDPKYDSGKFYGPQNIVERDPVFAELIDHPRHIGYCYDLYGELLKLQLSHAFVRPRDSAHNKWHPDGARAVPYGVFCPELALQVKVGYWLTDLPAPRMGNLVVMPRSHRQQYFDAYDTEDSVPGERVLCLPAGAMTLVHCNLWHRVEPNESDVVRKNLFYAYCVSWVTSGDRYQSDPGWLATLPRERRIIMRSYSHPYSHAKPPAEDFPLYLDRETRRDRDSRRYREHVSLNRRKRRLRHEKLRRQRPGAGQESRIQADNR